MDLTVPLYQKIWMDEVLMRSYAALVGLQDFICMWIIVEPCKPVGPIDWAVVFADLQSVRIIGRVEHGFDPSTLEFTVDFV